MGPSDLPLSIVSLRLVARLRLCLTSRLMVKRVLTPNEALKVERLPEGVAVLGSDYIAVEIAMIYAKLGVPVRLLIPEGENLLNEFDVTASRQVQAELRKIGIKIEKEIEDPTEAVAEAPLVIVSAGVVARTSDLALDRVGIVTDANGFVVADDRMRTSHPKVYAVGDVIGGPPLATLAIKQGKVAAEAIAGLPVQYAPQAVPRVAWTTPEIAAVGLTADEAKDAGYDVVIGRFPLGANGRALTLGMNTGVVLTVAEKESELLLGATIVAPQASALINEAALGIEMGATLTDFAETLHPHPSFRRGISRVL